MRRSLDSVRLSVGKHAHWRDGMCAMEAVAWATGEHHTDHPKCVCPVIAAVMRAVNDKMADDMRQTVLKPRLLQLVGTRRGKVAETRHVVILLDWLQRVALPIWLDYAKLTPQAAQLRSLPAATSLIELQQHARVETLAKVAVIPRAAAGTLQQRLQTRLGAALQFRGAITAVAQATERCSLDSIPTPGLLRRIAEHTAGEEWVVAGMTAITVVADAVREAAYTRALQRLVASGCWADAGSTTPTWSLASHTPMYETASAILDPVKDAVLAASATLIEQWAASHAT